MDAKVNTNCAVFTAFPYLSINTVLKVGKNCDILIPFSLTYVSLNVICTKVSKIWLLEFELFWKGHKNLKKSEISHLFWHYWVKTTVLSKQVGDFFQILWPSQNIWTLWMPHHEELYHLYVMSYSIPSQQQTAVKTLLKLQLKSHILTISTLLVCMTIL